MASPSFGMTPRPPPQSVYNAKDLPLLAATRRSDLRGAFMREDPRNTGRVAPFLVKTILESARLQIAPEKLERFKKDGRFDWITFCKTLERELDTFMHARPDADVRISGATGSYTGSTSPRRLPALLAAPVPKSTSFEATSVGAKYEAVLSQRRYLKEMRMRHISDAVDNEELNLSPRQMLLARMAEQTTAISKLSPREPILTPRANLSARPSPRANLSAQASATRLPTKSPRRSLASTEVGTGEEPAPQPPGEPALSFTPGGQGYVRMKPLGKKKGGSIIGATIDAINSRFSNMRLAFRYVDLDNSGTVCRAEIKRALKMFNIPCDDHHLNELMAKCDHNGDDHIDYKEFVDALARDTVAPAAMGKRGMQAQEAMGVPDLDPKWIKFSGWKPDQNVKMPSHEHPLARMESRGVDIETRANKAIQIAHDVMNSRFPDAFDAFQWVNLAHTGGIDKSELRRALQLWNVPSDELILTHIFNRFDLDGDGELNYSEFVDALVRDTVAPSAMLSKPARVKHAQDQHEIKKMTHQIKDYVDVKFKTLQAAFLAIDENRDGTLTKQEIKSALSTWNIFGDKNNEHAKERERLLNKLFNQIDASGEDCIDYEQFVATLAHSHMQKETVFGLNDDETGMVGHIGGTHAGAQMFINDNLEPTRHGIQGDHVHGSLKHSLNTGPKFKL